MAKYKKLADIFSKKIMQGHYPINSALPSLRQLCQLEKISMTTALACYRYLEQLGYVCSSEKRGFFVSQPRVDEHIVFPKFDASISEIITHSKHHVEQKSEFYRAELDPELSDTQLLSMSVSRIVKNKPKIFGYPEYQGYLELRQALAKHFTRQGFVHCAEQLVITHGCLNAVAIALAITTTKNGVVAVSSPCYSGLLELLASMKRKVLEIPSTPQGIDLAQLKRYMSEGKVQACLLTANHQNPTGHSICNEQKQTLVKLAETFEVPIIEDDVFRELNYLGDPPLPIKHYDHHGWVLWCSSVSKSLSAGLRLGWCSPGRYIDSYRDFVKAQSFGCNSITQLALADYIQRGHYQRHINKLKFTLSAQCLEYVTLIKTELQDQVIINSPKGGLVLWIGLTNGLAQYISDSLEKQGIAIMAGGYFSSLNIYDSYFRLNIGFQLTEQRRKLLKDICRCIQATKPTN